MEILTDDERSVLAQALSEYYEVVDDNCEDNELKRFIDKQIESISKKLNI